MGDTNTRDLAASDRLLFTESVQEGHPCGPPIDAAAATFLNNLQKTQTAGTAGTLVTAVEEGTYRNRITTLTLASHVITHGDNASLGTGSLIYTFPAGALVINSAYISLAIQTNSTTANGRADTPEIGLGTVIASGGVAVLGGTATFEDIMGGASTPVLGNMNSTVEVFTHASALKIDATDAHTVHLNLADAYHTDHDATAGTATGTVILDWTFLA
jgi:hypothetical protein